MNLVERARARNFMNERCLCAALFFAHTQSPLLHAPFSRNRFCPMSSCHGWLGWPEEAKYAQQQQQAARLQRHACECAVCRACWDTQPERVRIRESTQVSVWRAFANIIYIISTSGLWYLRCRFFHRLGVATAAHRNLRCSAVRFCIIFFFFLIRFLAESRSFSVNCTMRNTDTAMRTGPDNCSGYSAAALLHCCWIVIAESPKQRTQLATIACTQTHKYIHI